MKHVFVTAILVAALLAAQAGRVPAARELVDRVVAVVEDDAILQSDVEQMVKQLMIQQGVAELSGAERSQLEAEALTELVNNRLILAKANKMGIEVPFTRIEQSVEDAIKERKETLGGEEAFNKQLAAENLTIESLKQLYRDQFRSRMLVDQVLARDIDRSGADLTEAQLREAYEKRKDTLPARPAVVHLRTIYFAMESSKSAQSAAKLRVDELKRRLDAGEDFAKLAKEYSEDPSATKGGRLGTLNLSDLADRAFREAAGNLEVGEVSDPVLTAFGYHLIMVNAKDPDAGTIDLSHILVRVNPKDEDISEVFKRANDVHARLVAGAPFDSMAVRYSDDEATASKGGDLGWLRVNDLPEFFRDVLSNLKSGDMSPVLREPTGFRIVQLVEREPERPYRFEEVKEELRMATTYDVYLASLRDQFYVDIRNDSQ